MTLKILTLETSKEGWFEEAISTYRDKIGGYVKFEHLILKSKSRGRDLKDVKTREEAKQILERLDDKDFVVLCDEKGAKLESKAFAEKLSRALGSGKKSVVFIIGGAYGVSDEVRERANWEISLSPMTMNHRVAQVMLMEQIFRAFTIIKGVPYHNE